MNRTARIITASVLAAALCTGLGFLVHSTREDRSRLSCSRLEIHFKDSLKFVTADDIRGYLDSRYGRYIGQRLDSVDLPRIERLIESRSAVLKSEAWTTSDGTLHISITQRAPVMRFQDGDKGFYIASDGYIFPLHKSYTATVRTVSGSIPVNVPDGFKGEAPTAQERAWLASMLEMNRIIESSRTWRNITDSIFVRPGGDVGLKMSRGEELFILGEPHSLKEKFAGIEKYYDYIAPSVEEGYYKSVNLKYRRQIICRQKDT